jgi:hypothetical protein
MHPRLPCRLHALAAELVPGGISQEIVVCQARSLLEQHQPTGAVAVERHLLAIDLLDELDRLGTQRLSVLPVWQAPCARLGNRCGPQAWLADSHISRARRVVSWRRWCS